MEAYLSRREQLQSKKDQKDGKVKDRGGPGRGRSAARGKGRGRGRGRLGKVEKVAVVEEEKEVEEREEEENEDNQEMEKNEVKPEDDEVEPTANEAEVDAEAEDEDPPEVKEPPKMPTKRKRSKQPNSPAAKKAKRKSRAKGSKVAQPAEQDEATKKNKRGSVAKAKAQPKPKASASNPPRPLRPLADWPGFAALGVEPPREGEVDPHAVKAIKEFVDATDLGLELDGLKGNVRRRLPSLTKTRLNIYWTRHSCGVGLKDPWGRCRDVAYFNFTRTGLNPYVRMVVAISTALQVAPCLAPSYF